jgi:hypothetical protein
MATNDLQDLQDRINVLVSNDPDTPETTDDEWTLRLSLINQAIGKWETQDSLWDELWNTYTHASTVANGDSDYVLTLTDLRFPGGFVKLTLDGSDSWIEVISPEEFQKYGGSARVVYFTGNESDGWTLNLGWTPETGDGTVGATITFPYYKKATRLSATTDKSEIPDPNFIVYDVAATKSLLESKNNQFSVYSAESLNIMDRMRTMNEMKPNYQNFGIEDVDAISLGASIGF